jgi:hypothetical protein
VGQSFRLHSAIGHRGGERCVKGTFQSYIAKMTDDVATVFI